MADEEERKELLEVLEWIKGKNNDVDKRGGYAKEGTKWFIISMSWLNKLKRIKKLTDEIGDDQMEEDLGEIDSSDIIDFDPNHRILNNFLLKPNLTAGRDYEILPKKAWNYLSEKFKYTHKIMRKSIETDSYQTQIEITLFPLQVLFTTNDNLRSLTPLTFYVSRKDRLDDVIKFLREDLPKTSSIYTLKIRLWKLNRDTTISDLKTLLDTTDKKPITFPGILLESQYEAIDSLQIAHDDVLVAESKYNYSDFSLFKEKFKEMCEGCRKYSSGGRRCECKRYYYCNDMCEEKDRAYHYCRTIVKIYTRSPQSCLGKVGLQNLGNTCYMNSGLQCLSNTYPLTKYILDDLYIPEINTENPMGSKGKLIAEYAAFIKEMWYGTSHYVSPWGLKRVFGDFAKQFLGYHQQDSQEMLSFLIDGIHEDLNRIKQKPYIEDPDSNGLSEHEFSEKIWNNHLLRNNSIITDLMHGQYRSEVECPQCNKLSLAFDPFLMLTLPIPEKKTKTYEFFYIGDEKIKAKVTVESSSAESIRKGACKLLEIDENEVVLAETNMGSVKGLISDTVKVSKRATVLLYPKSSITETSEDFCVVFCDFRKKSYGYSGTTVGQPRILNIRKKTTFKELYFNVFSMIIDLKTQEETNKEELFRQKFPNFFTKSNYDNYFSLKVHNPYQYPCCICDRISCPGCPIGFEEKMLSNYLQSLKEPNLRLSVNFDSVTDTNFLSDFTIHDSYYTSSQKNTQETVNISECFSMFSKREQLDANNTTYCSRCKEHLRGIKKMDIVRLPKILMIHFKRFKQKEYSSKKNNKIVDFPIDGLDMSQFSLGCEGIYDLYAVSNHYGSLEGGHYTAYAKCEDGQWRDFDDSSVSIINNVSDQVISSSAYVLFYQRRD